MEMHSLIWEISANSAIDKRYLAQFAFKAVDENEDGFNFNKLIKPLTVLITNYKTPNRGTTLVDRSMVKRSVLNDSLRGPNFAT